MCVIESWGKWNSKALLRCRLSLLFMFIGSTDIACVYSKRLYPLLLLLLLFFKILLYFLPFAIVLRCSALRICISCFRSLLLFFPINISTLIYVNRSTNQSTNLVGIFVLLFSVYSHSAFWLSGRLSGLSVNAKSLLGTVYHGICTHTASVRPLSMYVVAFKLFHIKHGAALKRTTQSVTYIHYRCSFFHFSSSHQWFFQAFSVHIFHENFPRSLRSYDKRLLNVCMPLRHSSPHEHSYGKCKRKTMCAMMNE